MKAEKVYKILESIEKRDGLYEEEAINLLKFIYQVIDGKILTLTSDIGNVIEKPVVIIECEMEALKRAFGTNFMDDEVGLNIYNEYENESVISDFEKNVVAIVKTRLEEIKEEFEESTAKEQDDISQYALNTTDDKTSSVPQKKLGIFGRRKG